MKTVMCIAPQKFGTLAPMERLYFTGKEDDAARLAEHLRTVADTYGCHFLDASSVVTASATDGIHLDLENHRKLAAAVQAKVEAMLK